MASCIPRNRAEFTVADIARVTSAKVLGQASDDLTRRVVGISTDTRNIGHNAAFVALTGNQFDGHVFLSTAAECGATVALVERDVHVPQGLTVLRVASTLDALGALARERVAQWRAAQPNARVIAITGSAGKTTTRAAISGLLEVLHPRTILSTSGNLNNRIGLPMTLLDLRGEHTHAVVELGTSAPGEIAALAAIAQPDVAVLTLISEAHLSGLGSLDAIEKEKSSLLASLPGDGWAIGNGDDVRVAKSVARCSTHATYGTQSTCDVRIEGRTIEDVTRVRATVRVNGRSLSFTSSFLGEAGALACSAAIAVAELALGEHLRQDVLSSAFSAAPVDVQARRLQSRVLQDGTVVIDDSYNANPASVRASVSSACEIAKVRSARLILVLGEMRELGNESAALHEALGAALEASRPAGLIAVTGDAALLAREAARRGIPSIFASDANEAIRHVHTMVIAGDVVLVKGSNGVGMGRVVSALVDAKQSLPLETAL